MAECQSAWNAAFSVGAGKDIWLLAQDAGNLCTVTWTLMVSSYLDFFFVVLDIESGASRV